MKIDFHTHILPGVDDGSKNIETTEKMLIEEISQEVEVVIATPHFYAYRDSVSPFLERRKSSLKKLGDSISPKVIPGAEVAFFPGISKAERLPELCVEGTNTILLEMPFSQWGQNEVKEIRSIIENRKLKIVLAHVERFTKYQKRKDAMSIIMDMPLTIQINAGSFLKGWRKRQQSLAILEKYPGSIIASDCHNLEGRRPNLAAAEAVIKNKLGENIIADMEKSAEYLIRSKK